MRGVADPQLLARMGLSLAAGAVLSAFALTASSAAQIYQELDATRSRPLFAPTRRPPPAVPESTADIAPSAPNDPRPNVEVRGIIVGDNRRIAIIQRPAGAQTMRVAVGGEVDGWTVTDIRRRGIVLQRDSRTITLVMPEPGR